MNKDITPGTLQVKESHPAVESALAYYNSLDYNTLLRYQESFSSCAIEGNRLAEVCAETLHRLMNGEKTSDRYFLGLVWTIRSMEDAMDEDYGDDESLSTLAGY